MYDEAVGVARLTIITNAPARFTDATGALFYTEDGSATGGGGVHTSKTISIIIILSCCIVSYRYPCKCMHQLPYKLILPTSEL